MDGKDDGAVDIIVYVDWGRSWVGDSGSGGKSRLVTKAAPRSTSLALSCSWGFGREEMDEDRARLRIVRGVVSVVIARGAASCSPIPMDAMAAYAGSIGR